MTHQYVFDYHDGDIYWCTADVGWVTGHSYIVYGPLANGATTLMFEGVPNYPDPSRFWEVIDKHKVNIFYTAPTAIRALMRGGDGAGEEDFARQSLRLLGSVGEPINPEAWEWYHRVVGDGALPDRRYLVADRDRRHPDHAAARRHQAQARLGDASRSSAWCRDRRCRRQGAGRRGEGNLVHRRFLAGPDAHGLWRSPALHRDLFSTYPGKYFTGDGCRRDEDGYYWITGRVDDVINVSGHRMGTAEVESALVAHPRCRKPPSSAIRTTSRARASTPM
jgi:acetyl-CoA synthetase